ncbi:hypothetical protein [Humibacter albus]|uniref:hypothetical protein n=1 Tax=Humibacter albus TaxID=427754 RepID=UPI0003B567D1|nr:hypothetical protein [Humibacter albus]
MSDTITTSTDGSGSSGIPPAVADVENAINSTEGQQLVADVVGGMSLNARKIIYWVVGPIGAASGAIVSAGIAGGYPTVVLSTAGIVSAICGSITLATAGANLGK